MTEAFANKKHLRTASRLPSLTSKANVSEVEIAVLLGCGALAAASVGLLHLRIGVPGHAILRAVLPMAMGLALVPRRSGGLVMTAGAGMGLAAMSVGHVGFFPLPALISVLALGPVLDVAMLGRPQGWALYARFVGAGAIANVVAYCAKVVALQFGWSAAGGGQFLAHGPMALVSFLLCGAFAGLISAAIWFRLRVADDLRRD